MKATFLKLPIHHRQKIKVHLHQLLAQLCEEGAEVTAPKPLALWETSAGSLSGLLAAVDDDEQQAELAWRTALRGAVPEEGTNQGPKPPMARGDKSSHTDQQQRPAAHLEAGRQKMGLRPKDAEAWAGTTANPLRGGGKLSGSGRRQNQ